MFATKVFPSNKTMLKCRLQKFRRIQMFIDHVIKEGKKPKKSNFIPKMFYTYVCVCVSVCPNEHSQCHSRSNEISITCFLQLCICQYFWSSNKFKYRQFKNKPNLICLILTCRILTYIILAQSRGYQIALVLLGATYECSV